MNGRISEKVFIVSENPKARKALKRQWFFDQGASAGFGKPVPTTVGKTCAFFAFS